MPRTEVTGRQIKDKSVSLSDDVVDTLPVANGGTGVETLASGSVLVGNGTGAVQVVYPGTSGNVLTSDGSTWVSAVPAGGSGGTGATGPTGPVGPTGPTGPAGSDATVTSANIASALGYTPLPTTGTAASATRLATPRTFITDLGGTGSASFDGTGNATLGVTGSLPQSSVSGLTTDLAAKESTANKGVANGYASLNASGVIPYAQQTYLVLDGGSSNSPGIDAVDGGTP